MNRQLLGDIYTKSKGCCWYCGEDLPPFSNWEVEHQTPRSKGGSNDLSNLVAACRKCNSQKSDRDLSEYQEYLIAQLANQIYIAMSMTQKLEGPDMIDVFSHLREASRYLYDTHIVFWGEGRDPNDHEVCCDTATESIGTSESEAVQ